MLRSEAIAIIKRGLGFRQTQDSAIVAALKQVQRDLEMGKTLPGFLIAYDIACPVVGGNPNLTLPLRFLRLCEDFPCYYVNSDGMRVNVPRLKYQEAVDAFGMENSEADYPKALITRTPYTGLLLPTPTQSFTFYMTYYRGSLVLDTDVENLWLQWAPNYLVGLAGVQVAGDLRDKGAMEKFALMAKMGNSAYIGQVVDDELAGRSLIMGRNN